VTRASDKSTTGGAAATNKSLPLTSANWWPLIRTLSHVYAQAGRGKIADYGFLLAVNQNRVRVKLDQLNLRIKPPTLKSFLLPSGKYQLQAHINNAWMLRQCDDGRRYLQPPYALFFWAPDVKKVWPSDTPEGSPLDTSEVLEPPPATTTELAKPVERKPLEPDGRGEVDGWVFKYMNTHQSEIFDRGLVTNLHNRCPFDVGKRRIQNLVGHYRTTFLAVFKK
jgi:hypothetical protein